MPGTKKNSDCGHIGYAFNKLMKQIGHPGEFELPDCFNKWKDTPYTVIRRNIYLTKRIKRRLEDDGIFCSCTSSSPGSSVCGRDCHCGMLLSSCSSGCSCGSSCLNKPFQHRPVKKLKLIKTEKCGEGIVADEDIKHGESHSGDKEEHKRSKLLLDFLSFSASSFSSMARFSVVTDKVSMEVVEEFILEQLNLTKGTISEIKDNLETLLQKDIQADLVCCSICS
ncbi:hypothetical protein ES319_D01G148100v1 [Gossypium barbadense]|uniref:AWS domain-containing protein n=3 Tax=Gossypium TaxID=3633 RepID=A0A5J5SUQ5_GOSBA|nr:hypothetical protein ES319_D01G148100v1 [Gossypium barbadense]